MSASGGGAGVPGALDSSPLGGGGFSVRRDEPQLKSARIGAFRPRRVLPSAVN
jgi:hypothetical protein